ncbi:hypothetical protein AA313_de0210078 [Arthrobotrys entomopaga]|nr:hypothetical protein AA313_de0210078 [Arthrobotrys entomopaga]
MMSLGGSTSNTNRECARCESCPGVIPCSCGEDFCERCFNANHLRRNPTHRRKADQIYQQFWTKVTDTLASGINNLSDAFKRDEEAKWFGLVTKTNEKSRTSVIVETPRLSNLLENSLQVHADSPKIQFPSIVSFVGFTGAGKSVLIRSLIYHTARDGMFETLETPVPGASSGGSATVSTTGEVNLYPEPSTFGTKSPILYADCEGIMGSEPLAAKHQTQWFEYGRKYRIQIPMDRRTVVQKIYPRFLYIFSDVVCYVTRNHRSWADTAVRLLEWSSVGAQHAINQYTLPALIIILNGPSTEDKLWASDDLDAVTHDFFAAVENEIEHNDTLRLLATKYGVSTMAELFDRNYSSVHVHYIPFKGYGELGEPNIVYRQTEKLLHRIKLDSSRVQSQRMVSLTRFDSRQLSIITSLAFQHLASGTDKAFDFGQSRQHASIPDSLTYHIESYIWHCFNSNMKLRLEASVAALATSILKNALLAKDEGMVLVPSVIFVPAVQDACGKAMDRFRDTNIPCSYIDPETGARCVNTKSGHRKGHQAGSGLFLSIGEFREEIECIDTTKFLALVEQKVGELIRESTLTCQSKVGRWRSVIAEEHRRNIRILRSHEIYPRPGRAEDGDTFTTTNICYGCLFKTAEYRLPCRHVTCENCIRSNSEDDYDKLYTRKHTLNSCPICGTNVGPGWPFKVRLRPELSGLRVLSLDGGGVRGVIGLSLLWRLESLVGLSLPIGNFFDLIIGSGSGGIIALAIGIQNYNVKEFAHLFEDICTRSFAYNHHAKDLLKSAVRWLFTTSWYWTENIEKVLEDVFTLKDDASSRKSPSHLFGLENHCRVAVTTTVGQDCKLIANYNSGGNDTYLNSNVSVYTTARCTSATPGYFDPATHDGNICRDGGLKENNPINLCLAESKTIWGSDTNYDLILSVGPGTAARPQKLQTGSSFLKCIKQPWLRQILNAQLTTMNGEDVWRGYKNSQADRIVERSSRLNMKMMESAAYSYDAFEEPLPKTPFNPISERLEAGVLESLADRIRASLFYLQVNSIDKSDGFIIIVRGSIRCRLGPSDEGYAALLCTVLGFTVNGQPIQYISPSNAGVSYFNVGVEFSYESIEAPIRVDVNFKKQRGVAISGFPMSIKNIMDLWDPVNVESDAEAEPDDFLWGEDDGDSSDDFDTHTLRTDDVSDTEFV